MLEFKTLGVVELCRDGRGSSKRKKQRDLSKEKNPNEWRTPRNLGVSGISGIISGVAVDSSLPSPNCGALLDALGDSGEALDVFPLPCCGSGAGREEPGTPRTMLLELKFLPVPPGTFTAFHLALLLLLLLFFFCIFFLSSSLFLAGNLGIALTRWIGLGLAKVH